MKRLIKKKYSYLLHRQPTYETHALADDATRDKATNAAIPSTDAVEQTRDWSIENKQ